MTKQKKEEEESFFQTNIKQISHEETLKALVGLPEKPMASNAGHLCCITDNRQMNNVKFVLA